MAKWEYLCEWNLGRESGESENDCLDKLGSEGWELISVATVPLKELGNVSLAVDAQRYGS